MKKILVIEDTNSVRKEICLILHYEGYKVLEAENGKQGIEVAADELPDLVICDVMMPELDGYAVLNRLQEDHRTSTIPFIFLTARVTAEDRRKGMESGADDYLTKPFTRDELVQAIETRLRKSETVNKQYQDKMNEINRNIVYALPHELNTPLTTILGSAEMIVDYSEEELIKQLAGNITISSKRLEKLIKNFLIFTQLETLANDEQKLGELKNSFIDNPVHLIKAVTECVAAETGREKDMVLKLENAVICILEEDFRKIITELIDNAFKFSESGTEVSVETITGADYFSIIVTDHGRGMSVEQINNIGAYMQFDRRVFEQQGMGLGLTITKKLTELYDGNFILSSEKDKGTKVTLQFKYKPNSR